MSDNIAGVVGDPQYYKRGYRWCFAEFGKNIAKNLL